MSYRYIPYIATEIYLLVYTATILFRLNLISVFTGWVFYIDANDHYTYGPLFILQSVVCYFYLLIPTVKSLSRSLKTNSKIQRRDAAKD